MVENRLLILTRFSSICKCNEIHFYLPVNFINLLLNPTRFFHLCSLSHALFCVVAVVSYNCSNSLQRMAQVKMGLTNTNVSLGFQSNFI